MSETTIIKSHAISIDSLEPLPDENLFSMVSRYHRRSGVIDFKRTLYALFGDEPIDSGLDIKLSVDNFLNKLGMESKYEKLDWLERFSLLPTYSCIPDRYYSTFINHILYSNDINRTIFGVEDGRKIEFCYCPLCLHNDIQNYGVAYWHNIHMYNSGIVSCLIHERCCLVRVSNFYKIRSKKILVPVLPSDFYQDGDIENCLNPLKNTYNDSGSYFLLKEKYLDQYHII